MANKTITRGALGVLGAAALLLPTGVAHADTVSFEYTGPDVQTVTIPEHAQTLQIEAGGARGADGSTRSGSSGTGGIGSHVEAVIPVGNAQFPAGDVLQVNVGTQGGGAGFGGSGSGAGAN